MKTELIDAIGVAHQKIACNEHGVITPGQVRIVSLVPSITELICDLGLAQCLVGRTGFCIHPKEVLSGVAKIGGTKDVNIEKIRRLSPTHLIVNIDENEKPTVEQLAQFIPHVIVTHPNQAVDNLHLFRLLGGIFGVETRAEELVQALESALNLVVKGSAKKVLYCIWKDPWMTISQETYIANLLALKGWQQWQSSRSSVRYPTFDWQDPDLAELDMVLLSSEPYSFTQNHADELQAKIGKPVYLIDGEMLSWYGSRAIKGLAYLNTIG